MSLHVREGVGVTVTGERGRCHCGHEGGACATAHEGEGCVHCRHPILMDMFTVGLSECGMPAHTASHRHCCDVLPWQQNY